MGKRINELYIGNSYLNIEGRTIKHPALISEYGSLNINKIKDEPMDFIGIDLETNYLTAELKLLGIWRKGEYLWHDSKFLDVIFRFLKESYEHNRSFAYWNKLDPFVIYKQFLLLKDSNVNAKDSLYDYIKESMERYAKVGGEWDYKNKKWSIPPVIEVEDYFTGFMFGIKNVVRSSIQFFYYEPGDDKPKTVWAYDIKQLYKSGLEMEALGKKDKKTGLYPNARLPWYEKGDEELHKINWDRFYNDSDYERRVLRSNMMDARAAYELALNIQNEFFTAFGYYPKNLISAGSLARSAIVAVLKNYHDSLESDENIAKQNLLDDVKGINILSFYDEHIKYPKLKSLYALFSEAFSAGYIETIRYGYTANAYYADIASAYPAIIEKLWDLRGCKITDGIGVPPHIPYSYCFIRGDVNIPDNVNFHPITIKHPLHKETNIRAVGEYRASYTLEERDFLIEQGAKFTNEEWFNIETKGKLSPLAMVAKQLVELRTKLIANGDSAEYVVKLTANSLAGLTMEAVETYKSIKTEKDVEIDKIKYDNPYKALLKEYHHKIDFTNIEDELKYHLDTEYAKVRAMWACPKSVNGLKTDEIVDELREMGIPIESDNPAEILLEMNERYRTKLDVSNKQTFEEQDIVRTGYRAGEFNNFCYATIITSRIRLLIARNAVNIEKLGGKVVLIMTDALFWTGRDNMLLAADVRNVKTLGYFETPVKIKDLVCLGSGRYSYKNLDNEQMTSKNRGLNAVDFHNPDGINLGDFNWINALKIMRRERSQTIKLNVRTLISVGMVLNNHSITWKDLGLVMDDVRDVDLIVGKSKRIYDLSLKNPDLLATTLIDTKPIEIGYGMFGKAEIFDSTLPLLRKQMDFYEVQSLADRYKKNRCKAQKKYQKKPRVKNKVNAALKAKYDQLRGYGYNSTDARKMQKWSSDKITEKLLEDGKL